MPTGPAARKGRTTAGGPVGHADPRSRPRAVPQQPASAEVTALQLLLKIEELARAAADLAELHHLVVDETRKLNRARQIFLVSVAASERAKVIAVSGVSSVDQTSVLAGDVAATIDRLRREKGLAEAVEFTLPAFAAGDSDLALAYPFREMAWVPFLGRSGEPFAGMLMAREAVWTSGEMAISGRLAATYAHAWRALKPAGALAAARQRLASWKGAACLAALLGLLVPVPITALAPAEIVAAKVSIVAAPLDGVVENVEIDPNTRVKTGDVLLRFSETTLRNRRDIAAREMAVAEARVKQLTIMAFADAKGRQELAVADAELALKRAELAYADELLSRTVLRAPHDGIAVFADRRALVGRPVATGERLMEIAEPDHVEVRIDVAAGDVIALRQGGDAKLFLDVDPLRPLHGRIVRADYKARASDADVLSFRAFAELAIGGGPPPRIGLRGTAQIRGEHAPAAFALLRRPISSARQWLGY